MTFAPPTTNASVSAAGLYMPVFKSPANEYDGVAAAPKLASNPPENVLCTAVVAPRAVTDASVSVSVKLYCGTLSVLAINVAAPDEPVVVSVIGDW